MIEDTEATMPDGWLPDEPELIPDPDASRPSDWDDDMDGEWEAPQISNPACEEAPGCGEWTAPQIKNPKYKGKWKAPMIDNPSYQVGQFVIHYFLWLGIQHPCKVQYTVALLTKLSFRVTWQTS